METVNFKEKPRICLIDTPDEVVKSLEDAGYNLKIGTLGPIVRLPKISQGSTRCLPINRIPENLHEYDILVVDLRDREPIEYQPSEHQRKEIKEGEDVCILCSPPKNLFDARPFSATVLQSQISGIGRDTLLLVFTNRRETIEYEIALDMPGGYIPQDTIKFSNFDFLPGLPGTELREGFDTQLNPTLQGDFRNLLERYNEQFQYQVAFSHAMMWDPNGIGQIEDPDFLPLLRNPLDEIVSYAHWLENGTVVFVFPQLEDQEKADFVHKLLDEHLPALKPGFFPYSTRFSWLKDSSYWLPNEQRLREKQDQIQAEYEAKLAEVDVEIETNYRKSRFLHDMLTKTDAELVTAVEDYLDWLEFENIVNVDEIKEGDKEEDLMVDVPEGLLVIEVKGIGGTSTDNQCAQISKFRRRRERERRKLDVYGLYIVNHQRYLPPENRDNPPFSETQIKDAIDDERGLLTTYQLFKLYFAIEQGIITKEDARRAMLAYGLVSFSPTSALSLGNPSETHHSGQVGIFDISSTPINIGQDVFIDDDGRYQETTIVSLQVDDNDVDEVADGEVGIKFSKQIKRSNNIWVRRQDEVGET